MVPVTFFLHSNELNVGLKLFFFVFFRLNESAIEPLKLQLAHIESDIKDQIEIMDLARVDIMENEEKILKLLTEI